MRYWEDEVGGCKEKGVCVSVSVCMNMCWVVCLCECVRMSLCVYLCECMLAGCLNGRLTCTAGAQLHPEVNIARHPFSSLVDELPRKASCSWAPPPRKREK